jgi:hypothetical protein
VSQVSRLRPRIRATDVDWKPQTPLVSLGAYTDFLSHGTGAVAVAPVPIWPMLFDPVKLVTDEAALRLARVFSQEHPRYEPEWQMLHVDEPPLAENAFYSRLS